MNKLPLIEVLLLAFVSFDKPVSGNIDLLNAFTYLYTANVF